MTDDEQQPNSTPEQEQAPIEPTVDLPDFDDLPDFLDPHANVRDAGIEPETKDGTD